MGEWEAWVISLDDLELHCACPAPDKVVVILLAANDASARERQERVDLLLDLTPEAIVGYQQR